MANKCCHTEGHSRGFVELFHLWATRVAFGIGGGGFNKIVSHCPRRVGPMGGWRSSRRVDRRQGGSWTTPGRHFRVPVSASPQARRKGGMKDIIMCPSRVVEGVRSVCRPFSLAQLTAEGCGQPLRSHLFYYMYLTLYDLCFYYYLFFHFSSNYIYIFLLLFSPFPLHFLRLPVAGSQGRVRAPPRCGARGLRLRRLPPPGPGPSLPFSSGVIGGWSSICLFHRHRVLDTVLLTQTPRGNYN